MKLAPSFSIIIPTYQEAKNIPHLIERIAKLKLKKYTFEILLIDDNSNDGTKEISDTLKINYPWLNLIVRRENRSWNKSVLHGIQIAKFPILIFMDADLSHPPEIIPQMLTLLEQINVDMVIGSRYINGGNIDKSWPFYRKIISTFATLITKPLLPITIKDPLSGFIAIKKNSYALNGKLWNPVGTKLGLEVIVKSHIKNIIEIPICFEQRKFGESKLVTFKMALNYIKQICELWWFKFLRTKK